jgi:quercetin dioxygenase-like cupin family protein
MRFRRNLETEPTHENSGSVKSEPEQEEYVAMVAMSSVMRAGLRVALATTALGVSPVLAETVEPVKPPPAKASSFDFGGKNVFDQAIPNAEGKSMVAILVNYPPGGKSPPHHHAPSAFIYAYVLSGAVRSQVNDEPVKIHQAGEGFYELPGARHRISENASEEHPATMLAVYVVDSNDKPLTEADQK